MGQQSNGVRWEDIRIRLSGCNYLPRLQFLQTLDVEESSLLQTQEPISRGEIQNNLVFFSPHSLSCLFNDVDLMVCQAIQLIHQMVDLVIGGVNLTL